MAKKQTSLRKKKVPIVGFSSLLNTEQQAAVTHDGGPVLIIAGAGTGKTTVITERIAWLIREGKAKPEEILALTFTDKAAGEMEERIDRILPYGYVDLWVSTFHAFGERILREYGLEIGLDTSFKLLSAPDQWLMMRRNLERLHLEYYKPLGNPTKFLQALCDHFSRAKDESITPEEYIAYAQRSVSKAKTEEEKEEANKISEVANAYAIYETLLRETNTLDFGDLIVMAKKLLMTRATILKEFQKRFKYILVDEFQDTNIAQYQLVKLLAADDSHITVVGDDDQSIYKFRGAAVSNILEFKKDFPTSAEVVLTSNYRSRQNILDLAYDFIQRNNPHRLEAQLGEKQIGPKGMPLKRAINKRLKACTKGKGQIAYTCLSNAEAEARYILQTIAELKSSDPEAIWNDFAVLVRANSQAEPVVRALAAAGIPFQFVAARGLYQRPEIIDLIALLSVIENNHENPAMYRVLQMSLFGIPDSDIGLLLQHAHKKHFSVFTALEHLQEVSGISPDALPKFRATLELIQELSQLARHKTVGEVLYHFLASTKHLDRFDKDRDHEQILNISKLYRRIREFEDANDDKSIRAFIEETNLVVELGEDPSPVSIDEGPESVKIMTIHSAKGLEFRYVFLPQLVDRRFPSTERREPLPLPDALVREITFDGNPHLEEERRLMYVAITRAKQGVFFSSAEDYGGVRKKKPSQFLHELGLIESTPKPAVRERQLAMELKVPAKISTSPKRSASTSTEYSFTQLAAFRRCPKQYRYAHILKIPVTGNPNFSFGKSIHATLKSFYEMLKAGKSQSVDDLIAIYNANWIDDWYATDEDALRRKEAGRVALVEFYEANKAQFSALPLALEKPFKIRIGAYMIKGQIDRIDAIEGSTNDVVIIDYKTGSVPDTKNSKKADDLDQLLLYAIAAEESLGFHAKELMYYYVEHNTTVRVPLEGVSLNDVKQRVIDEIEQIQTSDFVATPGWYCKSCDFREICEDREI